MKRKIINIVIFSLLLFLSVSCVKFPDADKINKEREEKRSAAYLYAFNNESQNTVAEITIQTDGSTDLSVVDAEIPYLKYNKSWLFFLTQDDCKHDAFSCTWAAINGKPLSRQYCYDVAQLKAGDLPPDVYYLGKTLGSTDGTGNEVRFSFTTTLAPEWKWMDAETIVQIGYKVDYARFYMKSGLIWDNVIEILNYGNGIAFHDVKTSDENSLDSIIKHYKISQDIILSKLSGRGCKTLAEPNGNKAYVTAALSYDPIQTMTAQNETVVLYPFQVKDDLHKQLLGRGFYSPEDIMGGTTEAQLKLRKEERAAIHVGVHGTNYDWVSALLWLNDTYGKDGDDSVWFTSMEEYYEYNYYRIHGSVQKSVNNNTLKLTINLPSGKYFYYPSITVNLKGLNKGNITSVSSTDQVTGLSYGDYEGGVMFNINCRKFLVEHATHFVEQYENNKTNSNLADAHYFVNMLKESAKKQELLNRIK
ncbi:MAG: hypothetical protein ABFC28_08855 [Rikenellaceae bacterium]